MPQKPAGVDDGILNGLYKLRASENKRVRIKAHLLGSGSILNEALKAQELLENDFGIAADVWSVTSYKNLYWDAIESERRNFLQPEKKAQASFVERAFRSERGVFIAASDYLKALPATIAKWLPGPSILLGTDGFGRSETRAALREFFEVDARHIAYAAIVALAGENRVKAAVVKKARKQLEIDPGKDNPLTS